MTLGVHKSLGGLDLFSLSLKYTQHQTPFDTKKYSYKQKMVI